MINLFGLTSDRLNNVEVFLPSGALTPVGPGKAYVFCRHMCV